MKSKGFTYYQPNEKDLKDSFGDCVIRSFTKTEGKSWTQVFDELIPFAREFQCMPNGKPSYQAYLKHYGYTYTGISNKKGTKRPTVSSFAMGHKDGKYILVTANHLVAVDQGRFYDTWDSGDKCLYGYWTKEKEEK